MIKATWPAPMGEGTDPSGREIIRSHREAYAFCPDLICLIRRENNESLVLNT